LLKDIETGMWKWSSNEGVRIGMRKMIKGSTLILELVNSFEQDEHWTMQQMACAVN